MALHKSGVGNCHQNLTFGLVGWLVACESRSGCPRMKLRAMEASALKCTETLVQSAYPTGRLRLQQTCFPSLQFIRGWDGAIHSNSFLDELRWNDQPINSRLLLCRCR